jgi:hypothetical protein
MASSRQKRVIQLVRGGKSVRAAMLEAGYGPGCVDGLSSAMTRILGLAEEAAPEEEPALPFSPRFVGHLRTAGIESLNDLEGLSDNDLLSMDGIGDSAIREIRALVPAPDDEPEPETDPDETKE